VFIFINFAYLLLLFVCLLACLSGLFVAHLSVWIHLLHFHSRLSLLTPFITEFDDEIIISSMPFNSDIATLQELGVGAVVNMCREYAGPNYPPDIVQLRLPTRMRFKFNFRLLYFEFIYSYGLFLKSCLITS
jgi:hypothetical protein